MIHPVLSISEERSRIETLFHREESAQNRQEKRVQLYCLCVRENFPYDNKQRFKNSMNPQIKLSTGYFEISEVIDQYTNINHMII